MHALMHGDLSSSSYLTLPQLLRLQTFKVPDSAESLQEYQAGLHWLEDGAAWSSVGTSCLNGLSKDEFHRPTDCSKLKKSWRL